MTTLMDAPAIVSLPPIRQDVVDRLAALLAADDVIGFGQAERGLRATRAEVAAASAGLVEAHRLDLLTLQHALEVLDGVTGLPDPHP